MKDKFGNELTGKEYLTRWKEGMMKITPLQQSFLSLISFSFVFIGIIIGLVVMSIAGIWWVVLILVGSLFLTGISFLGTLQKYWALKKVEQKMEEINQGGLINEQ